MRIYKTQNIIAGILLITTLLSGTVLSSQRSATALTDTVVANVLPYCVVSTTEEESAPAEVSPGIYRSNIEGATINAVCNDLSGFDIYAVGYTGNVEGNNVLVNSSVSDPEGNFNIDSGLANSGDTSNWAMKINAVPGDITPVIADDFTPDDAEVDEYFLVPDELTRVASSSSAAGISGAKIKMSYAAYIKPGQAAGNYTGKVRFVIVHPSTVPEPEEPVDPEPEEP